MEVRYIDRVYKRPLMVIWALMAVGSLRPTPVLAWLPERGTVYEYQLRNDGTYEVIQFEGQKTSSKSGMLKNIELNFSLAGKPGSLWLSEIDLEIYLLENGYGKISDLNKATTDQVAAQNRAQIGKLGIWKSTQPPLSVPLPPGPGPKPWWDRDLLAWLTWANLHWAVSSWGGWLAVIAAISAVYRYFFYRKKARICFLGLEGVGKSWIYRRIMEPDITLEKLIEIRRTIARSSRANEPEQIGNYEVTSVFIDLPGGNPGIQAKEAFNAGKRGKSVWVVVVATTTGKADFNSSDSDKIDQSLLDRQLGYLSLPLGLLKLAKPALVLLVINKVDMFSKIDVGSASAKLAREQILANFIPHRDMLKSGCNEAGVPFEIEFVSAAEGWRAEIVSRKVREVFKS